MFTTTSVIHVFMDTSLIVIPYIHEYNTYIHEHKPYIHGVIFMNISLIFNDTTNSLYSCNSLIDMHVYIDIRLIFMVFTLIFMNINFFYIHEYNTVGPGIHRYQLQKSTASNWVVCQVQPYFLKSHCHTSILLSTFVPCVCGVNQSDRGQLVMQRALATKHDSGKECTSKRSQK